MVKSLIMKSRGFASEKWFILILSTLLIGFFSLPSAMADDLHQLYGVNHNGLYIGGGGGLEIPTGPDEDGFSTGIGGAFMIGYQFIKNLAAEIGINQGMGLYNSSGIPGTWSFADIFCFDIKPIIPLSSGSNLHFIVGIAYAGDLFGNTVTATNSSAIAQLGPGTGIDLGIGYEHYITNSSWSLGGEIIYHHVTSKQATDNSGYSYILPYPENASATSINFTFIHHF